jgi:hypothetical protein
MFATYVTAQRQQNQLEEQMKQEEKERRRQKLQQEKRAATSDAPAPIYECAGLQLHSENDVESDETEEDTRTAAFEESLVAARSMQLSRGRRTPIQDGLIHRLPCYLCSDCVSTCQMVTGT